MTLDHVIDMVQGRADDLAAWADLDAESGSNPEEVELLRADARQWNDAAVILKEIAKGIENR